MVVLGTVYPTLWRIASTLLTCTTSCNSLLICKLRLRIVHATDILYMVPLAPLPPPIILFLLTSLPHLFCLGYMFWVICNHVTPHTAAGGLEGRCTGVFGILFSRLAIPSPFCCLLNHKVNVFMFTSYSSRFLCFSRAGGR